MAPPVGPWAFRFRLLRARAAILWLRARRRLRPFGGYGRPGRPAVPRRADAVLQAFAARVPGGLATRLGPSMVTARRLTDTARRSTTIAWRSTVTAWHSKVTVRRSTGTVRSSTGTAWRADGGLRYGIALFAGFGLGLVLLERPTLRTIDLSWQASEPSPASAPRLVASTSRAVATTPGPTTYDAPSEPDAVASDRVARLDTLLAGDYARNSGTLADELQRWVAIDPFAMSSWMRNALASGADPEALMELRFVWLELDPDAALALGTPTDAPAELPYFLSRYATLMAERDHPSVAVRWTQTLEPELARIALRDVESGWARSAPAEYGEYLAGPDAAEPETLAERRASFAESWAGRDPEAALAWIGTIEGAERTALESRALARWARLDETATLDWLGRAGGGDRERDAERLADMIEESRARDR